MATSLRLNRELTRAYRCLCRDLDATVKVESIDLQYISEIRKDLLAYVETWTRPTDSYDWCLTPVAPAQQRAFDSLMDKVNSVFVLHRPFPIGSLHTADGFRQLYGLVSAPLKIRSTDVSDQQKVNYYEKFLDNEESCASWTVDRNNPVLSLSRQLSLRASTRLDLGWENIRAYSRSGPGAVYDGKRSKQIDRLHRSWQYYPIEAWFANANLWFDLQGTIDTEFDDNHCRLTLVPKDWKGPRGVFIHHKECMRMQLGQLQAFVDAIQRSWMATSHDPYSQLPNQEAALVGSYSGMWATLDLSDASDRIPLDLVRYLLPSHIDALVSLRAHYVAIEDSILPLRMFAPMGDARTFPVLTWVCLCLSTAAVLYQMDNRNAYRAVTPRLLHYASSCVRVFGDDIAVKSEYYDAVVSILEACNLKVNVGKSYKQGSFRESCGVDAFKGRDVTPFRIRSGLVDSTPLSRLVSSHNNAMLRGHVLYAGFLETYIQSRYGGAVAYTSNSVSNPNCLLSKWYRAKNLRLKQRISETHYQEVRNLISVEKQFPTESDDRWNLNDWLIRRSNSSRPLVVENLLANRPCVLRKVWERVL